MAKKTATKKTAKDGAQKTSDPTTLASSLFKANADKHLNFEKEVYYETPSGSLILDSELGGLPPGFHRFIGGSANGKTSQALTYMRNFLLADKTRRGMLVVTERLHPNMKERSGIDFVDTPDEWVDGTCLIVRSNVIEFVFGFIHELVKQNSRKYFFVVDSVDGLGREEDLVKPLTDSAKVAGGAVVTSDFCRKAALYLFHRGHTCIFISQNRAAIKSSQYAPTEQKQGKSSGGNAIQHYPEWVLEFLPRYNEDLIMAGPSPKKGEKPLGHYAKVKVHKDSREGHGSELRYPVAHFRKNGKSIWLELEVVDMLLALDLLRTSASWFSFEKSFQAELQEQGFAVEGPYQGIKTVRDLFSDDPKLLHYVYEKLKEIL